MHILGILCYNMDYEEDFGGFGRGGFDGDVGYYAESGASHDSRAVV